MSDIKPDDRGPNDETPQRTPLTQFNYESLIDRRIADAAAAGAFRNLPGSGKPQQNDEDALVPEDLRAAYRLLKANDFAPPWIEARAEIDAERTRLESWLQRANQRWPYANPAGRAALREEYRRMLNDLQRLIVNYNLTTPAAAGQIAGLRMAAELARLGGTNDT
ncbi:MAG TPA: DUF1992 domain-containing protein [Roseiflexaceae bacterium]|nr:DUF1992 domain-containing protein [Roseiflexaceae bacterium]HMP39594.1 DUF1992 domain-containing protein [Roseiflexaceae bacterium]